MRSKKTLMRPAPLALACVSTLAAAILPAAQALSIVNISMPSGSMDGGSWPGDSGVYSEAPGPAAVGIGRIVDPTSAFKFSMHDHGYLAPNVPDPLQSVVTYQFDSPAVVTGLELNVHANGISKVEALVGDSLGSLFSLGTFTGSLGAPTGSSMFSEHALNAFSWANTTPGLYFQFVVTETTLDNGYANYTALPTFHLPTPQGVPDSLGLPTVVATLIGVAALRRRTAHTG
ncbi:MAG: hypothetical protein JNK85_25670 [Verrucomicrobiales bacterium]|jgi:hypothetical protein|nr:hypothetical protein [Verrucomicrobiales bacterium]